MILREINDIPDDWEILKVRKKTPVRIRPCNGVEKFKVSWSDSMLISDPSVDIIVISDTGSEYPCKYDIFMDTYERNDNRCGGAVSKDIWDYEWIKKATYRLAKIPEGIVASVVTLEGQVDEVKFPNFVAIGPRNELYVNTYEFFTNSLETL